MEPQDITNLFTAGLGLATVWLAFETHRMATASKAAVVAAAQPFLSLRGTYVNLAKLQDLSAKNQGATRLGVRLCNPGRVLVKYKVVEMTASMSGHTVPAPAFETTGGVLHPDEEVTYFFPLIITSQPIQPPATGEIGLRIQFWTVESARKSLTAKLRISVTSQTTHEWMFLEGPTYDE
jgi:hypothetical protein